VLKVLLEGLFQLIPTSAIEKNAEGKAKETSQPKKLAKIGKEASLAKRGNMTRAAKTGRILKAFKLRMKEPEIELTKIALRAKREA
jgi:hypothetical protein